jgi:hypothetical protein
MIDELIKPFDTMEFKRFVKHLDTVKRPSNWSIRNDHEENHLRVSKWDQKDDQNEILSASRFSMTEWKCWE